MALPGNLLLAGEEWARKVEAAAFFGFGFFDLLDMLGFFATEVDLGAAASGRKSRSRADHQSETDQKTQGNFFHKHSFVKNETEKERKPFPLSKETSPFTSIPVADHSACPIITERFLIVSLFFFQIRKFS